MGLDSIELVMAFEEAFGISIPDAYAQMMLTPHAVIEFVECVGALMVSPTDESSSGATAYDMA